MIICERCVKGKESVRKIAGRYAGRENSGVMLIGKEDEVFGMTKELLESRVNDAGELGSDTEGESGNVNELAGRDEVHVTSSPGSIDQGMESEEGETTDTKRKAEDTDMERASKKSKLNDASTYSSEQTLQPASSISTSATTLQRGGSSSTTLASSTTSKTCTAPSLLSADDIPLNKLSRAGGRVNLYLANDWQSIWCRCEEVSLFFEVFTLAELEH